MWVEVGGDVVSEIYLQLARLSLLSAKVSLFLSLHTNASTPASHTHTDTHRHTHTQTQTDSHTQLSQTEISVCVCVCVCMCVQLSEKHQPHAWLLSMLQQFIVCNMKRKRLHLLCSV